MRVHLEEVVSNEQEDVKVMSAIRDIVKRGNDAEVRKGKEGKLKVLEVKKHITVE